MIRAKVGFPSKPLVLFLLLFWKMSYAAAHLLVLPISAQIHFEIEPPKKGGKKWTKFMSKVGSNQLQHWIKFCLTYKGWKNMLNYILKLFCESECREFSFCQALPFGYYTLHRVVKHLSKTMKKNKKGNAPLGIF